MRAQIAIRLLFVTIVSISFLLLVQLGLIELPQNVPSSSSDHLFYIPPRHRLSFNSSTLPLKCSEAQAQLIFKANFSRITLKEAFGGEKASPYWGLENVKMFPENNSSGQIEVLYPQNSSSPKYFKNVGGFGMRTRHSVEENAIAIFKWSVFFPEGFDFVHGGKLPGLYGGAKDLGVFCNGANPSHDCFSTRLMWRERGDMVVYLYADKNAQDFKICENSQNFCDPQRGWDLGRHNFTFLTGVWTDVEQRVKMNSPGEMNGLLSVWANGKERIRFDNIVYRTEEYPDIKVEGIMADTCFGGQEELYKTPKTQTASFRGFSLEQLDC